MLKKIQLTYLIGVTTLGLFSGVANASDSSPKCSRETMLEIQDLQQKKDLSHTSRDEVQEQQYELQLAKYPLDCVKASGKAQVAAIKDFITNKTSK
ncbi:hypothetical protein IM40_02995 [Candidatus Paracaedimonas acanthamoebae]|nr:hypothetical protein IM40_02995 [Candidatus Paracaedimonas acanthamoebae]